MRMLLAATGTSISLPWWMSLFLCVSVSLSVVLHMPLNRVASCLICLFECLSDSAWLAVWHFACLVVVAVCLVACVARQMFCLAWTFTALKLMDDEAYWISDCIWKWMRMRIWIWMNEWMDARVFAWPGRSFCWSFSVSGSTTWILPTVYRFLGLPLH